MEVFLDIGGRRVANIKWPDGQEIPVAGDQITHPQLLVSTIASRVFNLTHEGDIQITLNLK